MFESNGSEEDFGGRARIKALEADNTEIKEPLNAVFLGYSLEFSYDFGHY